VATTRSLTKVRVSKYTADSQYATEEYVLESLHSLKVKYGVPIFQLLSTLGKNMDSVSLSKDKPYLSFYARKTRDALRIIIRQRGEDIHLQAPLSILSSFPD
jgi:hypothetical protein